MKRIKLNENDIRAIIKEVVAESFKDKMNKIGSKIKKGWDNYEEWCNDGLEAENNAYIDGEELKQTLKNGVNRIGNGIKKGYQKAKQWIDDEEEKTLNAPNPMFWGDEDDETNESLKRVIKESVRQALKNNI